MLFCDDRYRKFNLSMDTRICKFSRPRFKVYFVLSQKEISILTFSVFNGFILKLFSHLGKKQMYQLRIVYRFHQTSSQFIHTSFNDLKVYKTANSCNTVIISNAFLQRSGRDCNIVSSFRTLPIVVFSFFFFFGSSRSWVK